MRLLSVDAVASLLDVSKAHVWNLTRDDPAFPKPIRFSARMTRWVESDLEQWVLSYKHKEKQHEAG